MLIAGAVCPHPPLLIPAALGAAGSDPPGELRKVSDATARAVAGLAAARPDLLVVVGGGAAEREYGADAAGGLHAFGVEVTIGAGEPVLPLSLTVGRWLLERGRLLGHPGSPAGAARAGPRGAGLRRGGRRGARRRGCPLARPARPGAGRGTAGGRPGGVAGAGGRGPWPPHGRAAAVHDGALRGPLPGRLLGGIPDGLTPCPNQ